MIIRLKIRIVREFAFTLHQAKALRVRIYEGRDLQTGRVGQRPPDHLSSAVADQQPVAVMHCRAEIIKAAVVGLIEQEHRGSGRDADMIQFGTWEQGGLDIHDAIGPCGDIKPVSPRYAGAVH